MSRQGKLYKYQKSFELGLQSQMEYRVNFLLSLFSSLFPMIMQCFLWTTIFANSKEKVISGYDFHHMIAYIILAGIINKLVAGGVEWEISGDIKDGGLNKFIIRPVSYFGYCFSAFMGGKVMQFGVVAVLLAVVLTGVNVWLSLGIDFERILLFLLSILLALLVNLFISFTVSAAAFWTTEAWGVFSLVSLLGQFASGGLFPLDILGGDFMRVLDVLPFKYVVYFPTNIINGKLLFPDIAQGILLQCLWILLLFLAAKVLWKIGMKKYIAVGG